MMTDIKVLYGKLWEEFPEGELVPLGYIDSADIDAETDSVDELEKNYIYASSKDSFEARLSHKSVASLRKFVQKCLVSNNWRRLHHGFPLRYRK